MFNNLKIIFHLTDENIEIEDDYITLNTTAERFLNEFNNGCSAIKCQNYIIPKSKINYIEFIELKEEGEEE